MLACWCSASAYVLAQILKHEPCFPCESASPFVQAYDAMILALTSEKAAAALAAMAREPASAPAWLAEFDSAALISSPVLAMFEGQREALAVCIEALTGGSKHVGLHLLGCIGLSWPKRRLSGQGLQA